MLRKILSLVRIGWTFRLPTARRKPADIVPPPPTEPPQENPDAPSSGGSNG